MLNPSIRQWGDGALVRTMRLASLALMRTFHFTVADDEEHMLAIVYFLLHREFPGSKISTFQSPIDAYEHIQKHGTDMVITDHGMGPMNGTELVKRLRQKAIEFPVIVMSNNPEVKSEALEAGADEFLDKGQISDLPGRVRDYLSDD